MTPTLYSAKSCRQCGCPVHRHLNIEKDDPGCVVDWSKPTHLVNIFRYDFSGLDKRVKGEWKPCR